jgi:FixJ family two-component response regulator
LALWPTWLRVPGTSISAVMAEGQFIAIIDDDPAVLKALKRLLCARSYQAETYDSAETFLASLPDSLPACLIVDLQMPVMTGLELQKHLRRSGIEIPVIIITAHDEAGTRERCRSAGAVTLLLKPLQESVLLAAIDDATTRPRC